MIEIVLRPLTHADVVGLVEVLAVVAAEGRWLGIEAPFDLDERAARIHRSLDHPQTFGGFVADHGQVVGNIDMTLEPYGVATVAMVLLDGYRGMGVGGRLLDAGVAWAAAAGAHKVALQVWPHNHRAIALYERLGFVHEGRLRRHYRRRNGECWDSLEMGLLLGPREASVSGQP